MRRDRNEISQMKTRQLQKELDRADALFWAWQADGLRPGFNVEAYADDIAEELISRGQDRG